MACKSCSSENQKIFHGELAIHFGGLAGLEKPIVWVFPKLLVCLRCGFAEFTVPGNELNVLVSGKAVPGVMVSAPTDRADKC